MLGYAWNESYSVNVSRCDEQHKKLFSLLNGLHQAMSVGSSRSIIAPVIQELHAYAKTHFQTEETLMEKTSYPDLAKHRAQHLSFVAKVEQFEANLNEGAVVSIEVADFVRDWLVNHIKKTDRLYGPHLNGKGIH
jgi:hemerythrin-like metal-binding protein